VHKARSRETKILVCVRYKLTHIYNHIHVYVLFWRLLPNHCRRRGLLSRLTTLNDTHHTQ